MKQLTRNVISIIKKLAVIALAILCIILLAAAIITLSKIIITLFVICLAVYWGFILWETVILPMLRKR